MRRRLGVASNLRRLCADSGTSARPRSGFRTLLAEFRCGLVARRSVRALTPWRHAENNSYFAHRKFEQACEFGLFLFGNVRQAINLIVARTGAREAEANAFGSRCSPPTSDRSCGEEAWSRHDVALIARKRDPVGRRRAMLSWEGGSSNPGGSLCAH